MTLVVGSDPFLLPNLVASVLVSYARRSPMLLCQIQRSMPLVPSPSATDRGSFWDRFVTALLRALSSWAG
jgi:hypothetical protein